MNDKCRRIMNGGVLQSCFEIFWIATHFCMTRFKTTGAKKYYKYSEIYNIHYANV